MKNKFVQFFQLIGLLVTCCGISSCANKNEAEIESHLILKYSEKFSKNVFVSNFDSVQFILQGDTLKYNISINSNQFLTQLQLKIQSIDTINSNKKTKTYIKSLLIADFVYAAFSYQFLGDDLGLPNSYSKMDKWENLTIEEKFDLGNKNYIAIDCGERTAFYKLLVDQLLNIPVRDTSIGGLHTYPITQIGSEEYIIDPSEPLVMTNKKGTQIFSFADLGIVKDSIRFMKSSREFGSTHLLISHHLKNAMNFDNIEFENQFRLYISSIDSLIKHQLPDCFKPEFNSNFKIYSLNNPYNSNALDFNHRNLGMKISRKNFYLNYFGKTCKN